MGTAPIEPQADPGSLSTLRYNGSVRMRSVSRQDFDAFVVARAGGLLRFARALTADADHADVVVRAVLRDARRHWPQVQESGGEDAIRRAIVQAALRPRRAVPEPEDAPLDAPALADDPVRLAALVEQMWPPHRVVLVLHHLERLPPDAIAGWTGRSSAEVTRWLDRAAASGALSRALRAHDGDRPAPADPGAWLDVRPARRGHVVLGAAALGALGVAALVAVVAVATVLPVNRPYLASGAAPAGSGLLAWPPSGDLLDDRPALAAGVAAWDAQAPPDSRPAGAVYPLFAGRLLGTAVFVLQAGGGTPNLAVVSGTPAQLVTTEQLPAAVGDVPALRLPVVFAAGRPAVHGDRARDALLLGPDVLRAAVSDAPAALGDSASGTEPRPVVGWQRVVASARTEGPLSGQPERPSGRPRWPSEGWVPLDAPQAPASVTALSPDVVGPVELEEVTAAGRQSRLWQLPGEGDPGLLLTAAPVQITDPTGRSGFSPDDYATVSQAWQRFGSGSQVTATFLARTRTPDGVALQLLELVGSDKSVLVQQGTRSGRTVCAAQRRLSRGDVEAYPFVVAACSYLSPQRTQRTTVLQGWTGPQTPPRLPVQVQLSRNEQTLTRLRATVRDLRLAVLVTPPRRPAQSLSVEATDTWNNLPAFTWRWRLDDGQP